MADEENKTNQTAVDLEEIYGGSKGFWEEMAAANKENKTEEASEYTLDAEKAKDVNISMDTAEKLDKTPSVTVDGNIPETPSVTVQGNMENPNYEYDAVKGAKADPITVNGDLSHLQDNQAPKEASPEQKQPEAKAPATPDFSEGFKLSEEAKERLNDKYKDYSATGIMERFASAKEPEEAFMAMFLGLMLYLPNQALEYIDQKEVEAKERKSYIENQMQAYDDALAKGKGWSGKEQFNKVYGDFVETFGNMPEMAAKLRKEHPELVDGLGLKFDENGRLDGNLNDKQIKALAERVIANNYDQTYGHKPSDKQLKALWTDCNNLLNAGAFKELGQERAAEAVAAKMNSPEATATPDVAKPEVSADNAQPQAAPEAVKPEITAEAERPAAEPQAPTTPAPEKEGNQAENNVASPAIPSSPNIENLQVNEKVLADETMRDKVIRVDAQPLEKRPPMNLQAAHDLSVSITTPAALKDEVSRYNVSIGGINEKEQEVQKNRDALTAARQPRQTAQPVNVNNISLTVGQERT